MRPKSLGWFAAVAALATLSHAPPLAAQPVPPADAADQDSPDQASPDPASGVTIYDREFFAPYGVVNARDMLERVPGMSAVIGVGFRAAEQRRGLRSDTDQVLINGKRSTGKETDVADYLERIPATQVLRIEVISGNVKELDSAVSGRVVNIVLKEDQTKGSGAFAGGFIYISNGVTRPSGQLSYSFDRGPLSVTLAAETRARFQPADVNDEIASPAGLPIGRLFEVRERDRQEYTGRARVAYALANGDSLQVNGFYLYYPQDDLDTTRVFRLGPAGETPLSAVEDRTKGHDAKLELTSDYVRQIGANSKFLGLAVFSKNSVVRDSTNFDLFPFGSSATGGDTRDEQRREIILRGTFQSNITDTQELEFGAEGALTTLDKDLDFFALRGGRRADIRVFNSDTRIKEKRAEIFSTYSWKPTDKLEFEPGLAAEFSELNQRGPDVVEQRTFKFAKPSFNVWYSASPQSRIFFSFVRDVGQLTFEDFAASFIREDNELVVGNPNLVPEKAWAFELGNEYRLANDAGLLQVKAIYKRVNDVNDRVPLGPGVSGPGNLGSGHSYGLRLEGSLKLSKLGLFDGVISATYLLQDSEVRDAFTGRKRRFGLQPKSETTVNYRHDVQSWGLSYGLEYSHFGPTIQSDIARFDRRTTGGDARVFAEKQLNRGLLLRVFMGNAFKIRNTRARTLFVGSQASGRVLQNEFRAEKPTYFIGVRLRSTF
ncbi:MAG: TonB-dependent receptor [Rhodospirillaceae bacterium]|nr:TonB-dependent receptor [Rhodospirillaceae bacterium]